jgi:sensor histidine kinase regulating citrate/malate metabolism
MKLNQRIMIMVSSLILVVVLLVGGLIMNEWLTTLRAQMANEALDIAITVAAHPDIQAQITTENGYIPIQNIVERIRLKTRVQYMYVINQSNQYFAHPDPIQLNKKVEEETMLLLLSTGKSEIVQASWPSVAIEAYTPIYQEGQPVGTVVVGLLNGRLYQEIRRSIYRFVAYLLIAIFLGMVFAHLMAKQIKETIFGLEPSEIAFLLGQQNLVLENQREGIVASDEHGRIILANASARDLLGLGADDVGQSIYRYRIRDGFTAVLKSKEALEAQEIKMGQGRVVLANFYPIHDQKGSFLGVLAGFEDWSAAKHRAEELTGIRELNYDLRAQNHEFMNKLHTIMGLLQLDEAEEAIAYISEISETRQEMLGRISQQIKEPSVAGLLLAKYNKALEKKILFTLDEASYLQELPEDMRVDEFISIVGNLIENALDELAGREESEVYIGIFGSDLGVHIAVEDNGRGIPNEIQEALFTRGSSSKGADRGFGLWTVHRIVTAFGGTIEYEGVNGASFSIWIPIRKEDGYADIDRRG